MKYTLFLYSDESAMAQVTPQDRQQMLGAFTAYTQSLREAGVFVTTDWLRPSGSASTLSLQGGSRRVQDGPFAATKEQLGGFYVIEVPNLDEALAWAERCPAARYGTIELRPSAFA